MANFISASSQGHLLIMTYDFSQRSGLGVFPLCKVMQKVLRTIHARENFGKKELQSCASGTLRTHVPVHNSEGIRTRPP